MGLLFVIGWAMQSVRAQPVQGDITSVGFEASTGGGRYVVRWGQWFPILVQITAEGSSPRGIALRCEQADLDGDRVVFLAPDTVANPGTPKRVWCYAVAQPRQAGVPSRLDILGDDGVLIGSTRIPQVETITNDTMLILDISRKRVTPLDMLNSDPSTGSDGSLIGRTYYRPICVAALPARNLPDRWWGLESVDVIVWDEPDPDMLTDPAQLPALIEWVRNGGQLVIGIGPAWSKIQKSPLATIMPIVGMQPPVEVRRLDALTRRFGLSGAKEFKTPVSVAVGELVPDALATVRDRLPDNRVINVVSMRSIGSGRVIAVATRLADLKRLNWLGMRDPFARQLFDLNRLESKFQQAEAENQWAISTPRLLYDSIVAPIEFRRVAGVRVLAAFAFVAAYILVATGGAWQWLKRHGLTHTSWTVFAVFAVVASVLSLGAVGLSRGVSGAVHTCSFVDLRSGSSDARAKTYFGYRSNRRQRVNLALPGEDNYLRPLAAVPGPGASDYATPARYQAIPAEALLSNTLMRATLKQFEGFWHGTLQDSVGANMSISAGLTASRRDGQVSPQSWIQNDLDVEIVGGYLLYIDPRLHELGDVPFRVAGLNKRNDRRAMGNKYLGSNTVPPAVNVLAVPVPAIKPGQRIAGWWSNGYVAHARRLQSWRASKRDPKKEPMLPTLRDVQLGWMGSFGFLGGQLDSTDAAALLASTRNLFLNNKPRGDFQSAGRGISTAGLSDMDVTHWLTRGQAVLLLVSDSPGPARLSIDGDPERVEVSEGRAYYRVLVPIRYDGRVTTGTTE